MTQQLSNFINGTFQESSASRWTDVINPATEEVVALQPVSTPEEVDQAVAAADTAFKTWGRTTPKDRQTALLALADAMEEHSDELVAAQFRNTGQPRPIIAREEVATGADHLRFFAGAARRLDGIAAGEYAEGLTSYVRREPIGVVAQISPWNYPLMMAIWKIGPALAAGNTVVLKPASTTPESTLELARISQGILPDGVLNVMVGSGSVTGDALVAHPIPGLVSITGSVEAGIRVAETAAKTLKRCHLELGGKAPAIVFGDADPAAIAADIVGAAFFNAGQDCTAATRVLVHRSIYDDMVAELVKAAEALKTGDAEDDSSDYGPLNNAGHLANVARFIEELPAHATVATGGHRIGTKGYYFAPTIVADVRQTDTLVQEEVFGPILTVQPFDTADEAIAMGNDVRFGLASSVWTNDHSLVLRATRELDFGCVWVNTHIPLVAEFPHGGFKASGYGKDLSLYAIEDYTRIKHIMSAN
ncbi:MAG: gamma-aminobutyraldehyde dehydrogenase [Propionibacteriaceae bacterium]|nr:gamma-aminobutyraldehyde dehydrogenase [Propionibacteriaceae bacterium]